MPKASFTSKIKLLSKFDENLCRNEVSRLLNCYKYFSRFFFNWRKTPANLLEGVGLISIVYLFSCFLFAVAGRSVRKEEKVLEMNVPSILMNNVICYV